MMRILFLMLVNILLISSCKTSWIKEYNNEGQLQEKYQILRKTQKKQGKCIRYHENGNIAQMQTYKNGVLTGKEQFFYEDGQLKEENTFNENGEFDGPATSYYPSGQKKSEGTYVKNALDGIYKTYYENGQLKEVVHLQNSEENGPFEEYAENGNLLYKGTYKNKKEFCLLEVYDEDGTGELVAKRLCRNASFGGAQCCTVWTRKEGLIRPKNQLCEEIVAEMKATCELKDEDLNE